jgi:predicted PurR-regulated permease PerM
MRRERQFLFWGLALALLILTLALLKDILLPFIVGIAIAYFLNPIADRFEVVGFNRTLAAALIVGAAGAIAIGFVIFLVPVVAEQARQFVEALPGEILRLKDLIDNWAKATFGERYPGLEAGFTKATDSLAANWPEIAGAVATSLWSRGMAVFNFLSLLLVTPLVVFYLLDSWKPMLARIDGWLPRDHAPSLRALASDMNRAVAAFVRGQGTVCLILGAFYAAALSYFDLKYGLVIGLTTGLFAFVPFVGWALGLLTGLGFAVVQFWPEIPPVLAVAGVFAAGQALDAVLLSPKIVGQKIGLHPVWLIFALFVFSYLFGFVGMLVAVPVAAAIAVLFRFALRLYLESSVYLGNNVPPGKV